MTDEGNNTEPDGPEHGETPNSYQEDGTGLDANPEAQKQKSDETEEPSSGADGKVEEEGRPIPNGERRDLEHQDSLPKEAGPETKITADQKTEIADSSSPKEDTEETKGILVDSVAGENLDINIFHHKTNAITIDYPKTTLSVLTACILISFLSLPFLPSYLKPLPPAALFMLLAYFIAAVSLKENRQVVFVFGLILYLPLSYIEQTLGNVHNAILFWLCIGFSTTVVLGYIVYSVSDSFKKGLVADEYMFRTAISMVLAVLFGVYFVFPFLRLLVSINIIIAILVCNGIMVVEVARSMSDTKIRYKKRRYFKKITFRVAFQRSKRLIVNMVILLAQSFVNTLIKFISKLNDVMDFMINLFVKIYCFIEAVFINMVKVYFRFIRSIASFVVYILLRYYINLCCVVIAAHFIFQSSYEIVDYIYEENVLSALKAAMYGLISLSLVMYYVLMGRYSSLKKRTFVYIGQYMENIAGLSAYGIVLFLPISIVLSGVSATSERLFSANMPYRFGLLSKIDLGIMLLVVIVLITKEFILGSSKKVEEDGKIKNESGTDSSSTVEAE